MCRLHAAKLVIAKMDRLARNVAFISNLMESGADFVAVDFPQANRLTVHILAAVAAPAVLNATRQSGKSTAAALKAAWTVLQGGLAVVVSPSLRQSGFLFRKLARHLVASDAAFRRET